MKRTIVFFVSTFFLTACTPGIGIGVPVGKIGYAGVGVNKNGLHPSAGVRVAPHVGVGVSL